jgi:hypothetical protein
MRAITPFVIGLALLVGAGCMRPAHRPEDRCVGRCVRRRCSVYRRGGDRIQRPVQAAREVLERRGVGRRFVDGSVPVSGRPVGLEPPSLHPGEGQGPPNRHPIVVSCSGPDLPLLAGHRTPAWHHCRKGSVPAALPASSGRPVLRLFERPRGVPVDPSQIMCRFYSSVPPRGVAAAAPQAAFTASLKPP